MVDIAIEAVVRATEAKDPMATISTTYVVIYFHIFNNVVQFLQLVLQEIQTTI